MLSLLKKRLVRLYPAYAVTAVACYYARQALFPPERDAPRVSVGDLEVHELKVHCRWTSLIAELLLTQTSVPFGRQCTPWLWPVALVLRLSGGLIVLAFVAHVVSLRLFALARLHHRVSAIVRRANITPALLLQLMCFAGVAYCVVRGAAKRGACFE